MMNSDAVIVTFSLMIPLVSFWILRYYCCSASRTDEIEGFITETTFRQIFAKE